MSSRTSETRSSTKQSTKMFFRFVFFRKPTVSFLTIMHTLDGNGFCILVHSHMIFLGWGICLALLYENNSRVLLSQLVAHRFAGKPYNYGAKNWILVTCDQTVLLKIVIFRSLKLFGRASCNKVTLLMPVLSRHGLFDNNNHKLLPELVPLLDPSNLLRYCKYSSSSMYNLFPFWFSSACCWARACFQCYLAIYHLELFKRIVLTFFRCRYQDLVLWCLVIELQCLSSSTRGTPQTVWMALRWSSRIWTGKEFVNFKTLTFYYLSDRCFDDKKIWTSIETQSSLYTTHFYIIRFTG